MARAFAEISFTPSVLAMQEQQGSAESYAKFLEPEADRGDRIGPAETEFILRMDGFYQATVSETGWPYVQFRGGPKGFIQILDDKTIAYADFRGNRQYVSTGNLAKCDRISIIFMDYPNRRRLKLFGRVKIVDKQEDGELLSELQPDGYRALPERSVIISVEALEWNCPQHIPERMTVEELEPQLAPLREEMAQLRRENEELRNAAGKSS